MKNALKYLLNRTGHNSSLRKYTINIYSAYRNFLPISPRQCNICGYTGFFQSVGRPARLDAKCPHCNSLERHRLLALALDREQIFADVKADDQVIHFAPEPVLENIFRNRWQNYTTADLYKKADLKLNIEKINLPSKSIKLIIANHVLEHVDDKKTGQELYRVLKSGGILICMVPIIEGWESTYENSSISSDYERWLHFGQDDHIRHYGRDFRERIANGGLTLLNEFTAEGDDVIHYGLLRGEKVFAFQKP